MGQYEMKAPYDPPPMQVSNEEMKAARLPLEWRDTCAHLLIPLNKCRRSNLWAPWSCKHEEHQYEICQYAGYKRRLLKQSYLKHHELHGSS